MRERRDVTAQTAMGTRCSNVAAGVRNDVRLEAGTQTEREREGLYSSAPALGQAVRVIYKYARCKATY